jgi:hypothetical protein
MIRTERTELKVGLHFDTIAHYGADVSTEARSLAILFAVEQWNATGKDI